MVAEKEISEICTSKDWETIRHEIKNWNNDKLEALRIFLLSGITSAVSVRLVPHAIDLSYYTSFNVKDAAVKIVDILNKFKVACRNQDI